MNRGSLGARALNVALQEALNADATPLLRALAGVYAPGDKVIQTITTMTKMCLTGTSDSHAGRLEEGKS